MTAAADAFSAFDEFELAGWAGKDAAAYDALLGRVTARVAEPLLDAAAVTAGQRILDVGAGPGYVAERAAARGASAAGIDFSPAMVSYAQARAPNVEFAVADARRLPFEAASFDAVVSAFLLMHLGSPAQAVREAVRVLRPGGRVAYSVWDDPSRGRWLAVFYGAVADAGAVPPAELPPAPDMFGLADDDAFAALLEAARLVDVHVAALAFPLAVASEDEFWNGLVLGTVRTGPLVRAQPAHVQTAIRRHFGERLEEFQTDDGYAVPVAVKIARGTKPT